MSDSSILGQVFDLIEKLTKDSEGNGGLLIAACEIDESGFPAIKAIKCSGSPAHSLAAIDMLQRMLDETYEEVHERIKTAVDRSAQSRLERAAEQFGKEISEMGEGDTDEERIRNIINEFKKRLGK